MPRRGNPNWDKPAEIRRAGPTMEVKRLRLTPAQYVDSRELRLWCEHHRNQFYVPESLLKNWRIEVEDNFSGAA